MSMLDDNQYGVNLADIIGRGSRRVASFEVLDGGLVVREQCDEYFGEKLSWGEVDTLTAWLRDAREK